MSDAYTKITLDVIKRNGKKVSFDASKIALAIKKGVDNVVISNDTDEEKKEIFWFFFKSFRKTLAIPEKFCYNKKAL